MLSLKTYFECEQVLADQPKLLTYTSNVKTIDTFKVPDEWKFLRFSRLNKGPTAFVTESRHLR